MSVFSLFNSQKDEVSLLFDIGSGSLAGAIVAFSKDKPPEILYSCRTRIVTKSSMVDSVILRRGLLAALKIITADLLQQGLATASSHSKKNLIEINSAHYILSSPWILSATKTIAFEQNTEFVIDKDLIKALLDEKAFEFAAEYDIGSSEQENASDSDIAIAEKSILSILINGKTTSAPYGKRARTLEILAHFSLTSQELVDDITAVVDSYFHIKNSHIHSSSLLKYSTLRDVYHQDRNFLLVDIHEELTDISVVKNGVLVELSSFPLGLHTIHRRIADDLGTTEEVAASNIRIFLNEKSEQKAGDAMKKMLNKIKAEWKKLFQHSLTPTHGQITTVPDKIFLMAGNSMQNFFVDFLKEEKFDPTVLNNGVFTVTPVLIDAYGPYCKYPKGTPQDTQLSIHGIAIDKIIQTESFF